MPLNYQTVRLGKGRHTSPEHGACVMELASMLAGEEFSDHPSCVSRPIAAFLRAYNDMLDDDRRQDLYDYASRTVGTAASGAVERSRGQRLLAWGEEMRSRRKARSLRSMFGRGAGGTTRRGDPEAAARYAIHSIHKISDATHASVLDLVDELIALGNCARAPLGFDLALAGSTAPRPHEAISGSS